MTATYFALDQDFRVSNLRRWYAVAAPNDTAVIVVPPDSYTIRLLRCDRDYVHWWPHGGRGVTVPLEDAVLRLQMLQQT
jgi:hypothetical protein